MKKSKEEKNESLKNLMERVKMGKAEDIEEMEINAYYWSGGVPHRLFQGKLSVSMIDFASSGYSELKNFMDDIIQIGNTEVA